jgi:general stress protein 26
MPHETRAEARNRDNEVPLEKKLDDLYRLIDGIEVAMFTTRRPDAQLVSRPMQTQRRTAGADLWFVTNRETDTLDELAHDAHVNLAYYRDRTREWVSVSGRALLTNDRDLIAGLYKPDWKAWLGESSAPECDRGPHDPRIALILVEADSVTYSRNDKPMPLVLFQVARAMVTGRPPNVADVREVSAAELHKPLKDADLR